MMHSIKMENSPEGFDVEFCSGYGFVASNKTTTNGSLAYLLRCLKLQGSRESVMAFARGVAKTDDLARQHVALMDNKPYGSTKPTDDELTARARAVFDKWDQPSGAGEVDRADAVNLARNCLGACNCVITKKGVRVLAEAVLSMDAALSAPVGADEEVTQDESQMVYLLGSMAMSTA